VGIALLFLSRKLQEHLETIPSKNWEEINRDKFKDHKTGCAEAGSHQLSSAITKKFKSHEKILLEEARSGQALQSRYTTQTGGDLCLWKVHY